jgi:hypothetical protein
MAAIPRPRLGGDCEAPGRLTCRCMDRGGMGPGGIPTKVPLAKDHPRGTKTETDGDPHPPEVGSRQPEG